MILEQGQEFRSTLRAAVETLKPEATCALLFSGGTDSLTVLWTLLDLGIKPTCYTFRLAEKESTDSRAAAKATETWNVPHKMVAVPSSDVQRLAEETGKVVRIIGSGRKTHVEVMWAYWHMLQQVQEKQVWSGLQADTLYGSSRSMAIRHSKKVAAEFAEARRILLAKPGQEGLAQAIRLADQFGKQLCAPYTDQRVREFMFRFSWKELNRPRQKMPAVLGFSGEYAQTAIYRKNDNLQCGSGTREVFARLLDDSGINPWEHRSPAKLYAALGGLL